LMHQVVVAQLAAARQGTHDESLNLARLYTNLRARRRRQGRRSRCNAGARRTLGSRSSRYCRCQSTCTATACSGQT
jgi:ribosomal protein L4